MLFKPEQLNLMRCEHVVILSACPLLLRVSIGTAVLTVCPPPLCWEPWSRSARTLTHMHTKTTMFITNYKVYTKLIMLNVVLTFSLFCPRVCPGVRPPQRAAHPPIRDQLQRSRALHQPLLPILQSSPRRRWWSWAETRRVPCID